MITTDYISAPGEILKEEFLVPLGISPVSARQGYRQARIGGVRHRQRASRHIRRDGVAALPCARNHAGLLAQLGGDLPDQDVRRLLHAGGRGADIAGAAWRATEATLRAAFLMPMRPCGVWARSVTYGTATATPGGSCRARLKAEGRPCHLCGQPIDYGLPPATLGASSWITWCR